MKSQKLELLAPAGCFPSLQAAIANGADAVYFGLAQLNMRARARRSFEGSDLAEICGLCREAGVKTYLALNTLLYEHDLDLCREMLVEAARQKVDAVILSDMAAVMMAREIGLEVNSDNPKLNHLLEAVKQREHDGYAYDGAEASFELLARRALESVPEYFNLRSFRVMDERRWNAVGELVTLSEATIKIDIGAQYFMKVAEGNGPVNALHAALAAAISGRYPAFETIKLTDFKVRVLSAGEGTGAVTRVLIESTNGSTRWTTIGVSENIVEASWQALIDSIVFGLMLTEDES